MKKKHDKILLVSLIVCIGLLVFEVQFMSHRSSPSESIAGEIITTLAAAPDHPLILQTKLPNVELKISSATFLNALGSARKVLPGNPTSLDAFTKRVTEAASKSQELDMTKMLDELDHSPSAFTIHRTITTIIDDGKIAVFDTRKKAPIIAIMKMQVGSPDATSQWTVQYSLGKNNVFWEEHYPS